MVMYILRGATARSRSGASAERSYTTANIRGGGREEQPHVQGAVTVRAQEGREELLHVQGREGSGEEIPLIQGKRNPSKMVGVARGIRGQAH